MNTALLALAVIFTATLLTLLLADYARFEQEIVRLEARAARIAKRLVTCELEDPADPGGECRAALSELARDPAAAACVHLLELSVTVTADWKPELWTGLNPVEATAGRSFQGWSSLRLEGLLGACGP